MRPHRRAQPDAVALKPDAGQECTEFSWLHRLGQHGQDAGHKSSLRSDPSRLASGNRQMGTESRKAICSYVWKGKKRRAGLRQAIQPAPYRRPWARSGSLGHGDMPHGTDDENILHHLILLRAASYAMSRNPLMIAEKSRPPAPAAANSSYNAAARVPIGTSASTSSAAAIASRKSLSISAVAKPPA